MKVSIASKVTQIHLLLQSYLIYHYHCQQSYFVFQKKVEMLFTFWKLAFTCRPERHQNYEVDSDSGLDKGQSFNF